MSLELIMQFRPIILFVCAICALVGLKTILSFFPKEMKHQWIKVIVGLVYACIFVAILDMPLHEKETIPLAKNESGEFFEKTGIPFSCKNGEMIEQIIFYESETGSELSLPMCYTYIWITAIKDDKNASIDIEHTYSLLRGRDLFLDESKVSLEFKLPKETAKELAEIWNVHLNE